MKLSSYMPFLLALRSKILKRVVTPSWGSLQDLR
jgi:hypothetical protein